MFTGYRFAVGTQHIKFCNGGDIVISLWRECFQAEETSFYRSRETYFLPAVTRSEGSFVRHFLSCQFQFFSILAVGFRCFLTEYVEDGFLQSFHRSLGRPLQVKNEDFILAFFQPAARYEKCLLRADFPETPHRMTVHPYHPFAPCTHVEEGVTYLVEFER